MAVRFINMYRQPATIDLDALKELAHDATSWAQIVETRGTDRERDYLTYGALIAEQTRDVEPVAALALANALMYLQPEFQSAFAAGFVSAQV